MEENHNSKIDSVESIENIPLTDSTSNSPPKKNRFNKRRVKVQKKVNEKPIETKTIITGSLADIVSGVANTISYPTYNDSISNVSDNNNKTKSLESIEAMNKYLETEEKVLSWLENDDGNDIDSSIPTTWQSFDMNMAMNESDEPKEESYKPKENRVRVLSRPKDKKPAIQVLKIQTRPQILVRPESLTKPPEKSKSEIINRPEILNRKKIQHKSTGVKGSNDSSKTKSKTKSKYNSKETKTKTTTNLNTNTKDQTKYERVKNERDENLQRIYDSIGTYMDELSGKYEFFGRVTKDDYQSILARVKTVSVTEYADDPMKVFMDVESITKSLLYKQ